MSGYLFIDHRNSPGMPDAMMVRAGYPAGSGKGLFECDTLQCAHCGGVQIKRFREGSVIASAPSIHRRLCVRAARAANFNKDLKVRGFRSWLQAVVLFRP